MAIDVFSLVTRFRTEGFGGVIAELKGIEAQAIKTSAALHQGTISLDRASSAALNGRKGFRDLTPAYAHQDEVLKKLNASTATQATAMSGLIGPLRALGITFGAFELGRFLKQSVDAAAELHILAQRTGATVETLSVLQFEGKQSGVTTAQIGQGFRGLAMALGNLRDGAPKTVEAFQRIGLSARQLKDLSVDQVFEKVAQRLAMLPDPFERAEAAQRIFGRGGADLLPILDAVATRGLKAMREEAEKLGAVIGTDMATKADKFTDSLTKLGLAAAGAARAIASHFLPSLTLLADSLAELFSRDFGTTLRHDLEDIARLLDLIVAKGSGRNLQLGALNAVQNAFGLQHGPDADWDPGAAILESGGHAESLSSRQRNRFGPGVELMTDAEIKEAADEQARRVKEYQRRVLDLVGLDEGMKPAKDLGSPFGPMGPMGIRNEDFSHLIKPGVGQGGETWVSRLIKQTDAAKESFKPVLAQFGQQLGAMLANGLAVGIGSALQDFKALKHLKNFILQGLGSIFASMGQAMITSGAAMIALMPFLSNIFTSGPALLAAGAVLSGLGIALGGIATGSGGGGGGGGSGGFERDRATHVTLTADGAGGIKPPTNQATVIKVLGKDSPEGQRIFAEYGHRASRRNLS